MKHGEFEQKEAKVTKEIRILVAGIAIWYRRVAAVVRQARDLHVAGPRKPPVSQPFVPFATFCSNSLCLLL